MSKYFRLTLTGTYMGVEWSNVWHYRSESDDDFQAPELIAEFQTQWFNAIRGIMNVGSELTKISAVDVPDTGDYASAVLSGLPGTFGAVSTKLPPAYTISIVVNTLGSVIRHGFKRFCGLDEAAMTSGIINAAFQALLDVLLAKFAANLENGGYTFFPIIPRYAATGGLITSYANVSGAAFSKFGYQKTRMT